MSVTVREGHKWPPRPATSPVSRQAVRELAILASTPPHWLREELLRALDEVDRLRQALEDVWDSEATDPYGAVAAIAYTALENR